MTDEYSPICNYPVCCSGFGGLGTERCRLILQYIPFFGWCFLCDSNYIIQYQFLGGKSWMAIFIERKDTILQKNNRMLFS
jgi:hypothetical protein